MTNVRSIHAISPMGDEKLNHNFCALYVKVKDSNMGISFDSDTTCSKKMGN